MTGFSFEVSSNCNSKRSTFSSFREGSSKTNLNLFRVSERGFETKLKPSLTVEEGGLKLNPKLFRISERGFKPHLRLCYHLLSPLVITVRCSLVRPTFVKNVGLDGVLQKCPAEPMIWSRWNDHYRYCG